MVNMIIQGTIERIPSLFLLQGRLRSNDSSFSLLKIKSASEKQFCFYKVIVYRMSEIIPQGPLENESSKIPKSERAIIHGAQACQASRLMTLLCKKWRAGRDS